MTAIGRTQLAAFRRCRPHRRSGPGDRGGAVSVAPSPAQWLSLDALRADIPRRAASRRPRVPARVRRPPGPRPSVSASSTCPASSGRTCSPGRPSRTVISASPVELAAEGRRPSHRRPRARRPLVADRPAPPRPDGPGARWATCSTFPTWDRSWARTIRCSHAASSCDCSTRRQRTRPGPAAGCPAGGRSRRRLGEHRGLLRRRRPWRPDRRAAPTHPRRPLRRRPRRRHRRSRRISAGCPDFSSGGSSYPCPTRSTSIAGIAPSVAAVRRGRGTGHRPQHWCRGHSLPSVRRRRPGPTARRSRRWPWQPGPVTPASPGAPSVAPRGAPRHGRAYALEAGPGLPLGLGDDGTTVAIDLITAPRPLLRHRPATQRHSTTLASVAPLAETGRPVAVIYAAVTADRAERHTRGASTAADSARFIASDVPHELGIIVDDAEATEGAPIDRPCSRQPSGRRRGRIRSRRRRRPPRRRALPRPRRRGRPARHRSGPRTKLADRRRAPADSGRRATTPTSRAVSRGHRRRRRRSRSPEPPARVPWTRLPRPRCISRVPHASERLSAKVQATRSTNSPSGARAGRGLNRPALSCVAGGSAPAYRACTALPRRITARPTSKALAASAGDRATKPGSGLPPGAGRARCPPTRGCGERRPRRRLPIRRPDTEPSDETGDLPHGRTESASTA